MQYPPPCSPAHDDGPRGPGGDPASVLRDPPDETRTVLSRITDAFFALDAQWRFTYINPRAEALMRRSSGTLLGQTLWSAFPTSDGPNFGEHYRRAMATQSAVSFESHYVPLDLWIEVTAYPSPDGLSVYFRDIAQRKAAEAQLRRREQDFVALAEHSPDVIHRFNAALQFTYLNSTSARESGLPPEVFLGRTLNDPALGLPEPMVQRWTQALEEAFASGRPGEVVVQYDGPNGERWFHIRLAPEHQPDGSVDSVLAIGRDITVQRRAELALRKSEERLRSLIEQASDVLLMFDPAGRFRFVSPAMERAFGHTPESLLDKPAHFIVHPEDSRHLDGAIALAHAQPGQTQICELRVRDSRDVWRPCAAAARIGSDDEGAPALMVNLRDLTDWKADADARRAEEERFRAMLMHAQDIIGILSPEGIVLYQTPAVERILGYRPEEMQGLNALDFTHPDERDVMREEIERLLQTPGQRSEVVYRCRHRDGSWRTLESRIWNLVDDPQIRGVVINARDVTERAAAQAALRESEARFRALSDSAPVGIWQSDTELTITYVNPWLWQLWELEDHRVPMDWWKKRIHPDDLDNMVARWSSVVTDKATVEFDYRLMLPEGRTRHLRVHAGPLWNDEGQIIGTVGTLEDTSERHRMEQELTRRAWHDTLTGLENRDRFRERVAAALEDAASHGCRRSVVLFIDLDDFKTVNDSLGHEVGDQLLVLVAMRLRGAAPADATVARLGGDEFAILLPGEDDLQSAYLTADRIVHVLAQPFVLDERQIHVGASIGIAAPRAGDTPDHVLRNADLAMYEAKRGGKKRYETFSPEMHATALDRLTLEVDLRRALRVGELLLHYQPIVDLTTRAIVGVEALVRWQHPDRGMIPPNAFIPLAEQCGLIHAVGHWVLKEACAKAAHWPAQAGQQVRLTVNVSARQMQSEHFVAEVAAVLAETGLAATALVLEITESTLMADRELMLQRLEQLKSLNVGIAIDDFGTGFSSLAYLQRFPIDVLKIDKSFVDTVAHGRKGAAITQTVVTLAAALGLRCIAEGVEDEAQARQLQALGCPAGQGYLFARPMVHDQLLAQWAACGSMAPAVDSLG